MDNAYGLEGARAEPAVERVLRCSGDAGHEDAKVGHHAQVESPVRCAGQAVVPGRVLLGPKAASAPSPLGAIVRRAVTQPTVVR